MNLSEITNQFVQLANRRDLSATPALQTTFINQAIMRIQRELRVPAMEKSIIVTIGSDYTGLVIPSDMIELINIIPQARLNRLRKCDVGRALELARTEGDPAEYARQAGMWILGPAPYPASTIRVDYYAELPALQYPTDSNVISIIAWDLIVYAALVQMGVYYSDTRTQDFEGQYQSIKSAVQNQSEEDDLNGGSEVMPCYSWPPEWYDYRDR